MKGTSKDVRVDSEYKKLMAFFKEVSPEVRGTLIGMVRNVSFLKVQLYDLMKLINKNGVVDTYTNGKDQEGTHINPNVTAYDKFFKNYNAGIRTLIDNLPKNDSFQEKKSKLEKFLEDD